MFEPKVGQELEFVEPCHVDERLIAKGTRVRVGYILPELGESRITLVVLDNNAPANTLVVDRHIVTMHCQLVTNSR